MLFASGRFPIFLDRRKANRVPERKKKEKEAEDGKGGEKEKRRKRRGGDSLVIRGLESHRISAYRFLPIGRKGPGPSPVRSRRTGGGREGGDKKKKGGKKGKGYK